MSKILWLLNILLLVAAGALTSLVTDHDPGPRWQTREDRIVSSVRDFSSGSDETTGAYSSKRRNRDRDLDDLWKRTLFRPERSPKTAAVPASQEKEEESPDPVLLELIGIGKIADRQAAIILEKKRRSVRRSTRARASSDSPELEQERTQHVYRVGDQISSTGYVLKEIRLGEVTLIRGDEELVLSLESGDAQSVTRRAAAAKEAERLAAAEAKDKSAKPAEEKTASIRPPPPPPPPVGVPGGPGASDQEERLRRAREIRERLLEARKRAREEAEK